MSSKVPINAAAWATGMNQPISVKSAPYTRPLAHEVVIKNHAVAINPADWIKLGNSMMFQWIKYPFVFGYDTSGEVAEIGSSVTRFKVGDRVVGHACGMNEKINKSSHSAFQNYTVLLEHMTTPIPDSLSFEKASVIPLGLSTAAWGLYDTNQLALEPPTTPKSKAGNGKTLLVWGGSTSVGVNAIQVSCLLFGPSQNLSLHSNN
jgi:NADPH:quinone reductase-like Zn-dependent oxidoreductase